MSKNDVYGEPRIMVIGNVIAKVYHPILTEEERERRMKEIAKAAAELLKD